MKIRVDTYVDDVLVMTNFTVIHEDVSISPDQSIPLTLPRKNPNMFEHSDEYMENHEAKMTEKRLKKLNNGDVLSGREIMVQEPKKRDRKPKERGRKVLDKIPDQALPRQRHGNLKFIESIEILNKPIEDIALGCQATPGRFIVRNTYFKGTIDDAREKFLKYLTEKRLQYVTAEEGMFPGILTWESWLMSEYNKQSK